MHKYKIIFFLTLLTCIVNAQGLYKINGIVVDSVSKEALVSATVIIEGKKIGTITNQSGWFAIEINAYDNLLISLVGYNTKRVKGIDIIKSEMPYVVVLSESPVLSKEVVAETENRREKNLRLLGYEQLTANQIKYTPSFGGESDIMKTIQMIPGVTSANENSTKLNIRGGESNQNLILIDGVQAYNPMHLYDFVSSFNTDAISNVELFKGSISSEYYGKLSSVLKINLKEGNKYKLRWGGGISILSSQLYIEGPINPNISYMFSLRRTYLDLILRLSNSDAGYSFNDLYGKVTYQISKKSKLFLSGYWGLDYATDFGNELNYNKWGNHVIHLRYNYIWNNNIFSDFSFSYSKFFTNFNWDIYHKSPYVIDYSFKNLNDIIMSNKNSIKTGGDIHFYDFKITSEMFSRTNDISHFINSYEGNFFINWKHNFSEKFIFEMGSVYSYFSENKTKEKSSNFEPRLNLCYYLSDNFSIKVAYTQMHQFIHSIVPYNYYLPNDIFYPSSEKLPYMKGNQFTIGSSKVFNVLNSEYDVSLDLYYNDMKNVPNIKNHFDNTDPYLLPDQLTIGKGWGYGLEFQLAKKEGKVNGWISYCWNRAKRLFDGINNNEAYDPKFHKTHQLNFVVNYNISEKFKLGAIYIISSGQPLTLPSHKYYIDDKPYVYYGNINSFRLPYYSRLDLNIVYCFNMWNGSWELFGSIFNLLMRKNPSFLYFDISEARFEKISLGLIPTIGVKFHY